MKRLTTICVIVCALGGVARAADVLSQLGITLQAAKEAVGSVLNGGIYNPGLPAAAFKLLPAAARGEAAAAGVAWLKAYTATPEFKGQYAKIRESRKPQPPEFQGTPEEELKRGEDDQNREMEESKKALATLPPELRAQMEEVMKATRAMLTQMNTPESRKIKLDTIKAERADRTKRYEDDTATWKRDYPENPAPIVANRLKEFLAASADVDFSAKLVSRNGRMVFENQAYEEKSSQWKMCFRAGKEATTAARAAVQAWLKELGG